MASRRQGRLRARRRWPSRGTAAAALLAVAAALAGAPAGWAQQQPNVILEPLRQAPQQQQQIQSTTRESEEQRLLRPARRVSYEDVLAHPDDIDLNFAFAQTQIQDGDLKGAGATLERILLISPELPRVRLLYAIVLYRLDDLDEAQRELETVRTYEMPASLRAELDRYVEQIQLRRQRTRYLLTASFNVQHDWNKNAAPASGQNLVNDVAGAVTGHSRRHADIGLLMQSRLDVTHDLGYQAHHQLTGAVSYFRDNQLNLSELDLSAFSAEVGGVYDASPVNFIPTLYRRNIRLGGLRYSVNTGGDFRVTHQLDAATQLYSLVEAELQQYHPVETLQTARDFDGWQYTGGLGVNYILNPAMRLTAEVDGIRKLANTTDDTKRNSYDGIRLILGHTWVFENGMFLLTTVSGESDEYQHADPAVSVNRRKDLIGRARVTYGIPVALLFEDEASDVPFLRDLTLSFSYEVVRQLSTLTNFTYNNRDESVGLSKRWEF